MTDTARFALITASPDEAVEILSSSYAPISIDTPGSTFDIDLERVACGGLTIYRTRSESGVIFENEHPYDAYNLAMVMAGGQTVEDCGVRKAGPVRPSRVLAVDASRARRVAFAPNLRFKGISIDTDLMHSCLYEMIGRPVEARVQFRPVLAENDAIVRLMMALADTFFSDFGGGSHVIDLPSIAKSLSETIAKVMLGGIPNNYTDQLRLESRTTPHPRHVTRAIEYMRTHLAHPLRMADIAAAAGTNVRSLQEAFRRFKGETPMGYLRALRLEGARSDLLNVAMPDSVATIAALWGFTHLGMFANYYRAAFGETPRHTLARRP